MAASILRMCMKDYKGVITVYLSVTWAVLLSLIVTLIHGASMAAVKVKAECALENSLNSVFAEYNRGLWDKYNLLYIDISYESNSPSVSNLEGRINDYFKGNLFVPEDEKFIFVKDLLGITEGNVVITDIEYATDRWGDVFFDQVCSYAKDVTETDVVNNMNNLISASSVYDYMHSDYGERYEEAVSNINDSVRDGEVLGDDFDVTNFFPELVPNMEDAAVSPMGMVVLGADYYKLSFNRVQLLNLSSHNIFKESGNMGWDGNETGLLDDVYFNEYVMNKFNNYTSVDADSPLLYEAEYIIHGSGNDGNNMCAVTNYIFLIRAGCNSISVYMDKEKMDLIKGASEVLSAVTKAPPEAWQTVLVLAWGGLEGIVDTRKIVLNSEKVPIIKDGDDFTTSLKGIINLIISKAEGTVGIESENAVDGTALDEGTLKDLMGMEIGYEEYLRLLLYMTPRPLRIFRTMDLIELNMRQTDGNEYFTMNALVSRIAVEASVITMDDVIYSAKRKYSYF